MFSPASEVLSDGPLLLSKAKYLAKHSLSHRKRLRMARPSEVLGWANALSYCRRARTSAHHPRCKGHERCSLGNVTSTPVAPIGRRPNTNQYLPSQQLTRQNFTLWVYSRQKTARLYRGHCIYHWILLMNGRIRPQNGIIQHIEQAIFSLKCNG